MPAAALTSCCTWAGSTVAAVVLSSRTATFSFLIAPGALLRTSWVLLSALFRTELLFSYWPVPCWYAVVQPGPEMLSGPSTPPAQLPVPLYASRLLLSESAGLDGSAL